MSVTLQPNKPKRKKKVAAAPLAAKKVEPKKVVNPLFEKRPKNFGIGTLTYCLSCSYTCHSVICLHLGRDTVAGYQKPILPCA